MSSRIFFIAILIMGLYCNPAWAGLFGPSTKEECTQKYVSKTQANAAAEIVYMACNDLFKSYDFQSYMNEFYDLQYLKYRVNPNTVQMEVADPIRNLPAERKRKLFTYLSLLDKQYRGAATPEDEKGLKVIRQQLIDESELYKENKIRNAKCILDLSALYDAKNDSAAKIVYMNSDCLKQK